MTASTPASGKAITGKGISRLQGWLIIALLILIAAINGITVAQNSDWLDGSMPPRHYFDYEQPQPANGGWFSYALSGNQR